MNNTVSYSELSTFGNCRVQWEFLYFYGLQAKRPDPLPEIGSLCHKGVECYWNNILALQEGQCDPGEDFIWAENLAIYAQEQEKQLITLFDPNSDSYMTAMRQLKNSCAISLEVVNRYINYYKEADINTTPILIEYPFELPLPNTGVSLKGKIDLLCQDKVTGKYILRDSKFTRGAFKTDEQILLNFQLGIYQWVCHQLGYNVDLLEYDQVKAIPFRKPEPTVKGDRLKKNGFYCDWPTYQETIREYGFDEYDYLDTMATLKEKEFYRRTFIQRSELELSNFAKDLTNRVNEFQIAKNNLIQLNRPQDPFDYDIPNPIYRTEEVGKCGWCPVKELCIEQLKGGDVEYLMDNYMTKPNYRDVSVEITDEEELG